MIIHIYPTVRADRSPFSYSTYAGNQGDPFRSVCGRNRYKHHPLDDDSELCEECVKGAKYQLGFTYKAQLERRKNESSPVQA